MFKQLRRAFWEYVKENLGIYTLVVLFFLAGIIMGSVLVRILAESQLIELGTTISYFLESLKNGCSDLLLPGDLFKASFKKNILFHFTVWVLGFLWLGFPFVLFVLILKGIALGFTTAFIVYRSSLKGLVFSLAALLPHNFFLVPAYILASATALTLSILKFKNRLGQRQVNRNKYHREYCYFMLIILILVVLGGLVEAYITPVFMRMAIKLV
ncbi:MAG: stage II sporulation protein M [Firmicutes bacterium]|nr:stage II sporulation protein M [Bacillota bacterium]